MMKIKEALTVSAFPIIMILILQAASVVSFMNCCSWPLMVFLYCAIGYLCFKANLGIEDAAITGAVAGMISGIVFAASIFVYNLLFGSVSSFVFSNAKDLAQSISGGAIGGFVVIILIPIFGMGGAILSFVGYSFLGKIKLKH
ncbi:MAG: hypothetical protein NTY68_03655 [Candidatus Micrarchaeota archaeon]|nr:hypothetical protein [Candidatus Micrarchaeota archaeon]